MNLVFQLVSLTISSVSNLGGDVLADVPRPVSQALADMVTAPQPRLFAPLLNARVGPAESIAVDNLVRALVMAAAVLTAVRRRRQLAGVARAVGAGVGRAEATRGLGLVQALIDRALMGRAVLCAAALDVELALVAAGAVAGVLLAVVRLGLLAVEAALEAALVREAEVAARHGDLAAALARLAAGEVEVAVDGLSPVREAHAHAPAAADQAAGDVHVAVAGPWHHGWLWAVGRHDAHVGVAEAATGLWAVGASSNIACKMRFTDVKLAESWTGTVSLATPVLRTYVREGLLFGAGSLRCAAPGAFTLPVERTIPVDWVSWVNAEGGVLVPRGLAGMVLAV